MTIDELLENMDDTLEEAIGLPFSGGRRMVDVEKVRDIIEEIRLNMPMEIQQAKAVVQDRANTLKKAKDEAEAIIKRAEERARAMVAKETIVKAAQQKAAEILSDAQTQSREMHTAVTNYCENLLQRTEDQLAKSAAEVKTVHASLRSGSKKRSAHRPAASDPRREE